MRLTPDGFSKDCSVGPYDPGATGEKVGFQTPTIKAKLHGNDASPGFLVFFAVPDLDIAMSKVTACAGPSRQVTGNVDIAQSCNYTSSVLKSRTMPTGRKVTTDYDDLGRIP